MTHKETVHAKGTIHLRDAIMANFNEQLFEKKLLSLKDTQDSISGLSSWCLQQPQHHKKIVQIWLQVLKKVKIEQRLSLFYLANDVIQYSKRKGYDFVESWGTALQRATTMVRGDDKVRTKVLRLFTIWNERNVYDESFLVDLVGLLSSRTPAQSAVPDAQDFQPSTLITKVRTCKTLEDDTDLRLKIVNESPISLSDIDALRSSLKDRRHGEDVVAEVEEGIGKIEAYIKALEKEIKERHELIDLLDLGDVFYETQRGEARIVCNAYRNFGTRVKALKRKLDDLLPTLASPVPSPDVNAPSPSPESDIELPTDNEKSLVLGDGMGMSSFIGSVLISEDAVTQLQPTYQPTIPPLPVEAPQQLATPAVTTPLDNLLAYPPPQLSHPPPPIPPPTQVQMQPPPMFGHPPVYSHHSSVLPLLGDGQNDFVNGGDNSFLSQGRNSPLSSFMGTGMSFLGNPSFQFDFNKDDSLDRRLPETDTPASPPTEHLPKDSPSDEMCQNTSKEGKPIEVISSGKTDRGFSLTEFLKSLMPSRNDQPSAVAPATPTRDPPLSVDAPVVTTPVPVPEPFQEKMWNLTLPPKFPSWTDSQASWNDVISSPPTYKENFGNSLDFEMPPEENSEDEADVPPSTVEVDHRNLISLTGSPLNDTGSRSWQQRSQTDYRKVSMPEIRGHSGTDIVESVDMEMSDEEDTQGSKIPKVLKKVLGVDSKHSSVETVAGGNQSISFNISGSNKSKLLVESPLKEAEEPKLKLHKLNSSPLRDEIDFDDVLLPPPPFPSLDKELMNNDFSGKRSSEGLNSPKRLKSDNSEIPEHKQIEQNNSGGITPVESDIMPNLPGLGLLDGSDCNTPQLPGILDSIGDSSEGCETELEDETAWVPPVSRPVMNLMPPPMPPPGGFRPPRMMRGGHWRGPPRRGMSPRFRSQQMGPNPNFQGHFRGNMRRPPRFPSRFV